MPSWRSCGRARSACDCGDCFAVADAGLLCARRDAAQSSVATHATPAIRTTDATLRKLLGANPREIDMAHGCGVRILRLGYDTRDMAIGMMALVRCPGGAESCAARLPRIYNCR